MDMVNFVGPAEATIKVTMIMMLRRVMVRCIGLMEVFIEVSGIAEYKTVSVS